MTNKEFINNLKIIADMGDKQIETLANLLIDYFSTEEKDAGFKVKEKK